MLRLGIVDFDSSHSIEFTRRFNHVGVDADQRVHGARIVLGCPGTSGMSPERIPGFTKQIQDCGVELVQRPEEMIGRIDAALVLSLCGAAHLPGARPFLEAGIPAYIDKPFACSLADARDMLQLAERFEVTLYHSSALAFCGEVLDLKTRAAQFGEVLGAISYGPAKRAEGNPGLFHYGVHAVALLFAVLGPGCESVCTTWTDGAEVVTGRWRDGRIGTLRGNRRGHTAYGFTAFCERGVLSEGASTRFAYRNLCGSIVDAFASGQPPVSHEQNLEEVCFVLAALESERRDGAVVALDSIN